ncbi:hypothetical protein KUV57_22415 [Epibacterium sp. DP7N7-1]|nr:hypothetical protein [Epibacterium sp. DP7N7-1]
MANSSDTGDAPMLPELLDQIPPDQNTELVTADVSFRFARTSDAMECLIVSTIDSGHYGALYGGKKGQKKRFWSDDEKRSMHRATSMMQTASCESYYVNLQPN